MPWATSYNVYTTTSNPRALIGNTTNTFFAQTGLPPNTPALFEVTAVQGTLEGPAAQSINAPYTLANAPLPKIIAAQSLSVSLSWQQNGNPNTTPYEITASTVLSVPSGP